MTNANRVLMILLLGVSLALSASHASYARAAHAMSLAGSQTIIICGTDGQAEAITLDRNGNPVDVPSAICANCADCTMVAGLVSRDLPDVQRSDCVTIGRFANPDDIADVPRRVEHPSRGPPSQKEV